MEALDNAGVRVHLRYRSAQMVPDLLFDTCVARWEAVDSCCSGLQWRLASLREGTRPWPQLSSVNLPPEVSPYLLLPLRLQTRHPVVGFGCVKRDLMPHPWSLFFLRGDVTLSLEESSPKTLGWTKKRRGSSLHHLTVLSSICV